MAAAVAVGLSAWDLYSRASRIQYIGAHLKGWLRCVSCTLRRCARLRSQPPPRHALPTI
jgi:hypothetical protein